MQDFNLNPTYSQKENVPVDTIKSGRVLVKSNQLFNAESSLMSHLSQIVNTLTSQISHSVASQKSLKTAMTTSDPRHSVFTSTSHNATSTVTM